MAADPERALHLAPNFQPDVDLVTAEGVIAFGVKGSGKSNLLALLVEQLGRFLLPQLILDSEGEQHSLLSLLPHGVLASAQRCPSGSDILHKGLQVIVDLHSWGSDEAAALAMCQLIDELFVASTAIAAHDRFPCAIHLDEAAYWLPQNSVTYLGKETRKTVVDTFHKLASRGRKQGLTPFLYTQSISEVRKETIRQAGIQVLMRQTLDIDVNRACESIYGATEKTRAALRAFGQGRAFVILPDGSQHRVQFHERQSEHGSHTPRVQTALVKFAATVDLSTLPMRDLTAPTQTAQAHRQQTMASGTAKRTPPPQTATERIADFLSVNPTLRPCELMRLVGCSKQHAARARLQYFETHPHLQDERAVVAESSPTATASQPIAVRLQQGYERLLERGINPVTHQKLAWETHVGHDAVAAFLQAKRGVKRADPHSDQQAREQDACSKG